MAAIIEESTITAKGQTTVPKAVRQALGVASGDRIAFRVDEHGVTVQRAIGDDEDPALWSFLNFLARDIEHQPDGLMALTPALAARIAELTHSIRIDLDAPIEGEVSL